MITLSVVVAVAVVHTLYKQHMICRYTEYIYYSYYYNA
jgi:hypothetical protein